MAAALGGAAGLATCVLLSRIITSAAAAALSTRRGRDVLAMAGFAALLSFGPVVSLTSSRELSTEDLAGLTDALGWSPLGWAWAAPGDLTQGRYVEGLVRLALAVLLALVLLRCVAAPARRHGARPAGHVGRVRGRRTRRPGAASAGSPARPWGRSPRARHLLAYATRASTSRR